MKQSKFLTILGMLLLIAAAPVGAEDVAGIDEMISGQVPVSVKTKMSGINSVVTDADLADLERHPNCLTSCWTGVKPKFNELKDKAKAFVVKADAWMDNALGQAGDMLEWANAHQDQFWGLSKFALQLIGDDDLMAKVKNLEKHSKHYGEKAKKVLGMVDSAQDVLRAHAVALNGIDRGALKGKVQTLFMELMIASADGKSNSRIFKSDGAQLNFGYENAEGVTVPLITFGADLANKDLANDEPVDGYTVAEQAKVSALLNSLDGTVPGMSDLDKTLLRKAVNSLASYGGEVVVNDTAATVDGVPARSVYVWAVGDEDKELPPIFKFHIPAPEAVDLIYDNPPMEDEGGTEGTTPAPDQPDVHVIEADVTGSPTTEV